MTSSNFQKLSLASALAGIFLAGCGGGGGSPETPIVQSTLLSGTVAGGAAVIGNVIVTDSKGATKGGTIEADGKYSIDVSGMTGPFMLKAAGTVGNTSVTYYSAATAADVGGTVNVTPFTNLIVSNIAAQMAETYFSDPANIAKIGTLITPEKIAAAETALQAKLQPVLTALGISNSIDLLRTTFAADHSGMDAVLDLVKVEVDTATNVVTLKNALTQIAIATDDASSSADDSTAADSTKLDGITMTAVTDLQAVVSKLNGFAALFATSVPTVATIENSGVFDTSANFMMSGQTFAEFASELSTEQDIIGLKFSNVDISLDASGTKGTLTAFISSNSSTFSEKIELTMVKLNGVWKVQGDGRIADVSVEAQARRNEWTAVNSTSTSGSFIQSGIRISIDPFSYNSSHTSAPVARAVITGPGLVGNIVMVPDTQNTWFKLLGTQFSDNLVIECGQAYDNGPQSAIVTSSCVNVAQALDNSEYTVVLQNAAGASLNGAGYKVTLPKQPYATSALTAANFPVITSITIDGQNVVPSLVVPGKSVSVAWTMPTGLASRHINIWANTSTDFSFFRVEKDLLPGATSALLGLSGMPTGTVTSAGVWLSGSDIYGRELAISKSVSSQ